MQLRRSGSAHRSGQRTSRTYAGQGNEVTSLAHKHGITRQKAREIIKKIGNDGAKLDEAAANLERERADPAC